MFEVIGCFFLLLIMLAAGIYFVKSGTLFLKTKNNGERKLNISEMRMLGNRQFLVVAEYEDKKMLIGVCPGRIDYLCPLGGTDEAYSNDLEKPVHSMENQSPYQS